MAHHSTVLAQLLQLVPRHEFETLAQRHHVGRKLRVMTRWSQFVALAVAQLSGRTSLRDIVSNLAAQAHKLYHLGSGKVSRSSLARTNANQPAELYEDLFSVMLARCQSVAPEHGFRFKNKLFSLDASMIDLSLSIFPWATYQKTKGAVKLHVGLDHSGYIPAFVAFTKGNIHEVQWARALKLPKGSIAVFDRGFSDYRWFNQLNTKGILFVTRLKRRAPYKVLKRRDVIRRKGLTSDQTILRTGKRAAHYTAPLRRIGYRDPETGRHYVFLTNTFHLAAATIAEIYRKRWEIELFFKWIKQNLKIKSFVGTSSNAVWTQLWVAMCVQLLLAYLKFTSRVKGSLREILRLLQLSLFERRALIPLLRGDPPVPRTQVHPGQLRFA